MSMANRWILLFIAASAEYRIMSDVTPESFVDRTNLVQKFS
jgi:hypothetical protein